MKKESKFQKDLIDTLHSLFPGCMVLKNDSSYIQGIPDLLLLYEDHWAALECKRHCAADKQPNQEYYVDMLNDMSFARFISPETKEEVLHDLQQAFES